MSSEVQAKWTNSERDSSEVPRSFSLMAYSTALTSWLVVASISLTRAASVCEKSAAMESRSRASSGESAFASAMPGSAHSAFSQATSTATRRFMRPYSEKTPRRGAAFAA